MRDLGVDCALGRCRRVKLQKARFRRGAHRNKKLGALKIPQPRINLRLFRGGVSSAMLWGSPCPSRREYLRTRPSRQLARHKFGHIDVVYDEIDLTTQQVEAWFKVLQRWKGDATALERGWGHTWQRLAKDNRWASVKGPFAATVAYLQDLSWTSPLGKGSRFKDPAASLGLDWWKALPASPAETPVVRTGLWETHEVLDTQGLVFATDASGGEFTSDPRLRRVGVSAVALRREGDTLKEVGRLSAQVPGAQIVFRGELFAVGLLLRFTQGPLDLTLVCQGVPKRVKASKPGRSNAALWQLTQDHNPQRIDWHWVPSHKDEATLLKKVGLQHLWRRTNDIADKACGEYAATLRPPDRIVNPRAPQPAWASRPRSRPRQPAAGLPA